MTGDGSLERSRSGRRTSPRDARPAVVILLWLSFAASALAQTIPAQPTQPEPLEPDRPDVTNGTHVVDVGLVQLEIGGQYARVTSTDRAFGSPITVRVGLIDWLEARFGTDGFLRQTSADATVTGVGNVQLGAKLRLWADPGGIPVLSILPTVNLPAASAQKGLGSGQPDYTIALLTGTDLTDESHVDVNYGIGLIGAGRDRPHFTQHLASISASRTIGPHVNPYVEAFWFSRQDVDGTAIVSMDAGAIVTLSPRVALDGGFEWGVSAAAPHVSVFGGLSMIVGDILGDHGVHARQRKAQRAAAKRPPKKR